MLKQIFIGFLSLLCFGLIACSSPEAGGESSAGSGQISSGLSTDYADAMPIANQLAAGSVALENGDNAITEEQAATLLPLWQAYAGLVANGGTAEAELTALINQISREMNEDQIAEIAALRLTDEKLQEMITAGEIQLGRGRGGFGGAQAGQEGQGGQGGQGGGRGGGLGGQGGGGGGLGNLSQDDIATRRAERVEAVGGEDAFRSQQVSGAVVRLLSVKVNGEQAGQGGGQNPFAIAIEIVASELDLSADELRASLSEANGEKSIQDLIEDAGGDVDAITAKLEEALADSRPAQNGNLDQFIEALLAGDGQGRGGGRGQGDN